MGMIKHSQRTENNKFAISLQRLKKKLAIKFLNKIRRTKAKAVFVFYCDTKHSDTLWESSCVCCYLFEI